MATTKNLKGLLNKGDEFIFRKLEDETEGRRYNERSRRFKSSYIGERCIAMSLSEPYTMLFSDGTRWALNACELSYLDGTRFKPIPKEIPSRRKRCICIETGKSYNSYREAALDVGTTESNIRNAVNDPVGKAKGFHWRKLEEGKNNEEQMD